MLRGSPVVRAGAGAARTPRRTSFFLRKERTDSGGGTTSSSSSAVGNDAQDKTKKVVRKIVKKIKKKPLQTSTDDEVPPPRDSVFGHEQAFAAALYNGSSIDLLPEEARTEEESIARLGMGGYVSPHASGFSGLFRQQWRDFVVTEMPSLGQTLSRVPNDTIPSIRSLFNLSVADEEGVAGGNREGEEENAGAHHPHQEQEKVAPVRRGTPKTLNDLEFQGGSHTDHLIGVSEQTDYFTECSMHKQNISHSSALNHIWTTLKVRPQDISYAGVKDREGDTIQRIRVRNVSPEVLQKCSFNRLGPEDLDASPGDEAANNEKQEGEEDGDDVSEEETVRRQTALEEAARKQLERMEKDEDLPEILGSTLDEHEVPQLQDEALGEGGMLRLSNFRYCSEPLLHGDLIGNRFKIVLRDVELPRHLLHHSIEEFRQNGFPNYYGAQRFGMFGGANDPAVFLLRRDILGFTYSLLDYTTETHTLRELLQRMKKYPNGFQNLFRRHAVTELKNRDIGPPGLDLAFSYASVRPPNGSHLVKQQRSVLEALMLAFQASQGPFRRLKLQALPSYLWNQALTARAKTVGLRDVLIGDLVLPKELRALATTSSERAFIKRKVQMVTEENISEFTIEDVVHPGFSWCSGVLPNNEVGQLYHAICKKYSLPWSIDSTSYIQGNDFMEAFRPIVRKPLDLTYDYDEGARILTLDFGLERGCYATVALTELMKADRCIGQEQTVVLPMHSRWWDYGAQDPSRVVTMEEIYGLGDQELKGGKYHAKVEHYTDSVVDEGVRPDTAEPIYEHEGPLFLHAHEDPVEKIRKWGEIHLVRNGLRPEILNKELRESLFEEGLSQHIHDEEFSNYVEHPVPLRPNDSVSRFRHTVRERRRKASQGTPQYKPFMAREAAKKSLKGKASYVSIQRDAWNRMW